MNVVPRDRKIIILNALVEGNSIRSIERMTGTHRDTIMRLLLFAGNRCEDLLDEKMRDIPAKEIQCDELWCFVGKKDKRLTAQDGPEKGSFFIFVAMDPNSKLGTLFLRREAHSGHRNGLYGGFGISSPKQKSAQHGWLPALC